jgi:uncharacterized protein involved in exopolysaccharide biosynthesis
MPLDWKKSLKAPLALAFLAAMLMIVYSLRVPNQYKAEVSILNDAGKRTNMRTGLWAPSEREDMGSGKEEGPTIAYADILKSRWLGERLLQQVYSFGERKWTFGPGKEERKEQTLLEYLDVEDLDRGFARLKNLLIVQRDMKSGLLTIRVETRSPELSLQVARKAASLLEEYLTQLTQKVGDSKKSFTERQLRAAQKEYDDVERRLMGFLSANRNYQSSPDPTVQVRGARLYMELERAKQVVTTLALHHEQAQLDAANDIPSLMILDDGSLPTVKSRPSRSFWVASAFVIVFLLVWVAQNRAWIKASLLS